MYASRHELQAAAAEVLPADVFGYYATGAGAERTLVENELAWDRWWLRPRRLTGAREADMTTTLLGRTLSHPVGVGPAAGHGWAHPDGELATARAAASTGGLLVLSTSSHVSVEQVAAVPGLVCWFQLYAFDDPSATTALVRRAESAGVRALVVTVDVLSDVIPHARPRGGFAPPAEPPFAHHAQDPTGVRQLGWDTIATIAEQTDLPIVLKGILHPEDAAQAAAMGLAGVVVSNHGGRTLDGVVPTAVALPDVVAAAGGRLEVYVDGGIRGGGDILRALALGARAAFVARPILWALALAGEQGVRTLLERYVRELRTDASFAGLGSITDIPRDLVVEANGSAPG